jgi:hypothetical protein
MSSASPTPTFPGRTPPSNPPNFPGGGGGGGGGGGKPENLAPSPSTLTLFPSARQPDLKPLSIHLSWFVHPEQNPTCPLVTLADHPLPATLLLLLAISVVIVGRSIVIRRRARRVIEDAIRNGTWLPQAGRPVVKLGEKPKLFDVHTTVPAISPVDDSLLAWGHLKARPPSSAPSDQ